MNGSKKGCFWAALALLVSAATTSAAPPPFDADYLIDTWETEDGLPENSATAMVQMPDGYLMFGTFGGLVKFDGVRFTRLGRDTSPQAPEGGIVNLHLDRAGRLWVSTYRGTGVIEKGVFRPFGEKDGWRGDFVRSFTERENGDILLTTFNGVLLEYRGERFHELPPPPGDAKQSYLGHADESGNWWVAQHAFIGRWDGQQWVSTVQTTSQVNVGIGRARDGGMWLLIGQQLRKIRHGQESSRLDLPEDPGGFWSLFEDSAGNVWICTHDRGVCRIDPTGRMRRWRAEQGLAADGVRFVFEDHEGTLWIGTSGGGLNRFRQRRFQSIGGEQGLPRRTVTSVAPDGDGALIATYGGGLLRWDGTKLDPLTFPQQHGGGTYIQSVLKDRAGRTWAGTFGAALVLADKDGSRPIPGERTGGSNVIALFEDSRGRIWISGGQTVAVHEDGKYRVFPEEQEFTLNGIFCFAEDSSGAIWLTNGDRVMRLQGDRFTVVRDEQEQPIKGVSGLHPDRDATMWVMTYDGLLRWRSGKLARISTTAPLSSAVNILEDDRGFFWIATPGGVVRVSRDDLHAAADHGTPLTKFHILDKSDGLPSLDFSSGRQPLGGRDARGRLWFATLKGAAVTDPAQFRVNEAMPRMYLEELTYFPSAPPGAGSESQEHGNTEGQTKLAAPFREGVTLPPGSRRLEFRYTGLSFAAPGKVQFEIKLDGLDTRWQNVGDRRSAYYHELPSGNYTFHVRAANNDGVWSQSPASLGFTIQPFYWQTLPFQVGVAAVLVGVGAGGAWWLAHARSQQRRRADERFRLVVEASPNSMVMVNRQGVITLVNTQTESTFGYTRAELIGQVIETLVPARQAAAHPALRDAYFANPLARPMGAGRELFGRHRDGSEIPVEVGLTPIQTPQGLFVLASIVDIRQRKRAELESARQRNELAHLSRVTMLGELSGSLAHELNQPLASILSNAQAAQRFLARDEIDLSEVRDILNDIVDQDKRAGEIIRRLRLLLKKGEVQRQNVNLNEIVMEVLRLVNSDLINQGVSTRMELSMALPTVSGDRVQLQQVLLNLVMNACDAMVSLASQERQLLIVTEPTEPAGVHLCVVDCGNGIAPDRLEKIFDPFVSTKSAGMGLGLTVCRTIVTTHGGKLWATNNDDRGATLHVSIPAIPPPA